jgi:hypothetical protein
MKQFLLGAIVIGAAFSAHAVGEVRWHNEETDTTKITEILTTAASHKFANPSARTAYVARQFVDVPYVAHTLEGEEEKLTVNLDELDCTTFVDVALAFSYTIGEHRDGWQDFLYNLERLRYRGGKLDGYASRLHYNCDWAVDNIYRGNIEDATTNLPRTTYMIRTVEYMSAHRSSYPALKDSTEYARILAMENSYRNHRFPYIKTTDLAQKDVDAALREGDVVAFVSNLKDLDVTHMGIIVKENGRTHVLHASSTDGKVEISKLPLAEFVKKNRSWIGIRVYRLKE